MSKPLHVIYITGLGDSNPKAQRKVVGWWRHYGVTTELIRMSWADKRPWDEKLTRILEAIDSAASAGKAVGLVGVSAGASAAINAYAARKDKLSGAVLICGWVNRPEDVNPYHNQKNPAFVTSANQSPISLAKLTDEDRRHIMSRYGVADELVTKSHSRIPGAVNRMVPTAGHVITIATQIIFGAPSFLRFLKRQSAKI